MQQYCLPTFFSLHMLRTAGPEIGKFVGIKICCGILRTGRKPNKKRSEPDLLLLA